MNKNFVNKFVKKYLHVEFGFNVIFLGRSSNFLSIATFSLIMSNHEAAL